VSMPTLARLAYPTWGIPLSQTDVQIQACPIKKRKWRCPASMNFNHRIVHTKTKTGQLPVALQ
jgi:hypothetical protein